MLCIVVVFCVCLCCGVFVCFVWFAFCVSGFVCVVACLRFVCICVLDVWGVLYWVLFLLVQSNEEHRVYWVFIFVWSCAGL